MRRPSPALVVALVALFVALGGPSYAAGLISGSQIKKNSITSKQVRNHSLSTKDLSRSAVRTLRITPDGSVTQSKLANGAVTSAKIAGAAITGAKIAANSIGPIQIANGSLSAADIARFWGPVTMPVSKPIQPQTCVSYEPLGLAPELAHADISNDVIDIAPDKAFDDTKLVLSRRNATDNASRFVISLCNVAKTQALAGTYHFRYIVFHLP